MKHLRQSAFRRMVSVILTLTLVFGSASELFTGLSAALAEGAATPTDLMPRYTEEAVSAEPEPVGSGQETENPAPEVSPEETVVESPSEPISGEAAVIEDAEVWIFEELPEPEGEPVGEAAPAADVAREVLSESAVSAEEAGQEEPAPEETVENPMAAELQSAAAASAAAVLKDSDAKVSVLQQMVQKALDSAAGKNGRIAITLSQYTTYEGDVLIQKDASTTYGDDFGLDLVAEDAGEDGLQADGSTKVKGNITINGISVRLTGLAVGGAISVTGAKVDIYGTKLGDAVTVTAGQDSAVTVATGAGNDTITATASDGATLSVDAGQGVDTVTASVLNGAVLTVDSGEGDDTLDVTASSGTAMVTAGAGNDKVNLRNESGGDITADTGDGNDQVTVGAEAGMTNLTVDTGDGDDQVDIRRQDQDESASPAGTIQVSLGAGNDEASVNINVSETAASVNIDGGDDGDRLTFTGILNSEVEADQRIAGTTDALQLAGEKHTLTVTSTGVEEYSDTLVNKRTVQLTPGSLGTLTYTADKPFTNYVINAPSNKLSSLTITTADGRQLPLSSVIINQESTEGDGNKLVIGQGSALTVNGLRLVLKARNIEVNGTIIADSVEMTAMDGIGLNQVIVDPYNARGKGETAQPIVNPDGTLAVDLFNVSHEATIVIGETAAVYSAGDVILVAKIEQNGGIISFLPNVNMVDVKVARAGIDIAGKVYAGYDSTKQASTNDHGGVKAEASVSTRMGYDEKNKVETGYPLAVNVASVESAVSVRQGALVEAARNVTLNASTAVNAVARADSGLGGLPASIGVSVLLSDVHTDVDGQVNANAGNVNILAGGSMTGRTIAERGDGQTILSGGYVGVAVALQDVAAKINPTAVVNAAGNVTVKSVARETVKTQATSGAATVDDGAAGSGAGETILTEALKGLWPVIREKISSETAQEKLDKALKKLVTSNKSVRLDDEAGKKGDVQLDLDEAGEGAQTVTGTITVTPWTGYKVKSITWRGYNPGDSTYTTGTVNSGESFTLQAQTVTFFVEYEEDTARKKNRKNQRKKTTGLFGDGEGTAAEDVDIGQLIDDTTYSINDDGDDGDEGEDAPPAPAVTMPLTLTGTDGAVLTYETDPQDGTKSLSEVAPGQRIRLIPNPNAGKALQQGGLKVTYTVQENDKTVTKTEIVNPDGQNRYWFTVPAEADAEKGIAISAAFVDDGAPDGEADETRTQATGALAVSVTRNDNEALVDAGAAVTSGGKTQIIAEATTDITSTADGTSMTREGADSTAQADADAIKRPAPKAYAGFDAPGREFALLLDGSENGTVTFAKGAADYLYTFTATPAESYSVVSALLVYYVNGVRTTKELTADGGQYTVNLLDIPMDKGSAARIGFGFGKDGAAGEAASTQAGQAIIPNAIQIAYNALTDENNLSGYVFAGKIYYQEAKTDESGKITAYVFTASPDASQGYLLDGALKAGWIDLSGNPQEVALIQQADGTWTLDPGAVPEGTLITVSGTFKEDFHPFKVDTEKTVHGTVELHDEQLKRADAPRMTINPDPGYSLADLAVTYTQDGVQKTIRLSDPDSPIRKAKDKEGKELDNVYTFDVPGLTTATDITVQADYQLKSIGLYAGDGDTAKDYTLSEKNAAPGDGITILPSDDQKKQGNKVASYIVKNDAGKTILSGDGDAFTIPADTAGDAKLTVVATMGQKAVALAEAQLDNGTITPDLPRADAGEKVTVTITPASNFIAKRGSVKAVIKANDGSYTEEIYMSRQSDKAYSFVMPAEIDPPDAVTVTFTGTFEPGQANDSGRETSLGAGIAVTVAGSENRAEVKGSLTSGGDVAVKATQQGGAKTETTAGYSKGRVGIGGAVAVQVASLNSRALLHEGSQTALNGALNLESSAVVNDTVNADAFGSVEAENVGVGAGIAVAVNGSDAFAAAADGAGLTATNAAGALQGIALTANQKIQDLVSARAGAAGGTAVVPVAAVDVAGFSAEAYLGKARADALGVTGRTGVSAMNQTTHTITADASATGKGAGIGAAIGVSVATDTATATINQSISGGDVTVASQTISDLTETATASASGGKATGKSADGQANGLLNGAARAAGKNGSQNVSSDKIDSATKNRQKAQTSEGTVGVAGAVVVNIQEGTSRSEIPDGVNITSGGMAAVTAANRTEAKIRANASTTNSDIGIGVGAAVNIVAMNNLATIGNGTIQAAALRVAATTIEKPPAQKTVLPTPVPTPDALAEALGNVVADYMNDLAKELGLDQYVPDTLLGDLLGPVVTQATDALISVSGLGDAMGKPDWNKNMDAALARLSDRTSALLELPEKLAEPLLSTLREAADLGNLTPEQLDGIKQTLQAEFSTQLLSQLGTAGMNVVTGVRDGMIGYLKDNLSELMGAFSGGVDEGIETIVGKLAAQAGKEIGKATQNALKALLVNTWKETLTRLTDSVPGLSQENLDRAVRAFEELKDAYENESVSKIISDAAEYAKTTFKTTVFDYELMLNNLAQKDFVSDLADALRTGAKKLAVTMTNSMISKLTSFFDLKLEAAEAKAVGHMISTEAISGAGARDIGIAGSAAITVLNAATAATLAEDGGAITVSGDAAVNADELRSVRNVASAALDAKGKADANKAEEKNANKDAGGGSDAQVVVSGAHAKLTMGPGGTAEILAGDQGDDKPKMYIGVRDGYALPEDQKANYTYANGNGAEVRGTIDIQKDDQGRLYVDPKSGDLAKLDDKTDVALEITPAEVLNTIAKPSILTDGKAVVEEGAVTVGVEGREAKDDTLSARAGETVQVTIAKGDDRKVTWVGYSWTDEEGKQHDIELNTATDPEKSQEFTLVASNEKEYIYSFTMPGGQVTDVVVAFEEGEAEDAQDAKSSAKEESGKRVGVGASFSLIYGETAVTADVGKRGITSGSLSVTAGSDHKENVAGSAGTDPLGGALDIDQTKKYALDAAVALNILDNTVQAGAKAGSAIRTSTGDLTVTAKETGITETNASAFAVGSRTAVGASVAVNIATTGVTVALASGATVAGNATIDAASHSEDTTNALATALGADIARNLVKLRQTTDDLAKKANQVMDGSYIDSLSGETDNETANLINGKLNDNKRRSGSDASGAASTSSNVLRSLGVETQSESAGQEGTAEAENLIQDNTGNDVSLGREKSDKKWQAAAAVGVTVAAHTAETTVGAITAGGTIAATAENTGNFNTQGTGAAMSLAKQASAIAAGVAVSVNSNRAKVAAGGDLISNNKGDITVASTLTQNLDGKFAGKLAAQSLSGSVAGNDSSVSIGGAISVIASEAESTATIAGGEAKAPRTLSGGAITVEATDKSKLAARAGGLSISKGSGLGMGIASTNIVSGNTVSALVGKNTAITAGSFRLNAEKLAVTADDYKSLIDLQYVITDSSDMTEDQRKTADTGIIDIHKGSGENNYQVDVKLSSQKLLSAMDGLNFLSAQNTYLEAIAGTLMTGSARKEQKNGDSYLSLAGSVAVAVTNNTITSRLGRGATVTLTGDETHDGGMTLHAGDGNNARIITGALAASPAKASVGAAVSVLIGEDTVLAETGAGTTVKADGDIAQQAESTGEIQSFTVAMSVATGSGAEAAIGGAVNVIVNKNHSASILGKNVTWTAGGAESVESRTAMDLITISGSAGVTATSAVAAGGAVNVIYDKATAGTTLGIQNSLTAGTDLTVASKVKDRALAGSASLSAAISQKDTVAGAANVLIGRSAAGTDIGTGVALTATAGDLTAAADNNAWMLTASLSLAGGGKNAIGAAFNVDVVDRAAKVAMKDGTMKAGGNLITRASGLDTDILAGLSIAASASQGSGLSGNAVVLVESSEIGVSFSKGVTAEAGGNAIIESYYQDRIIDVAGSIAAALSKNAVGATVSTMVKENTISTRLGSSSVTARNTQNTPAQDMAGKDISGIFVGASAVETQTIGAAGIAMAGEAAINGVVNVLVNNNEVTSDASEAVLSARGAQARSGKRIGEGGGGDVTVLAREDTTQLLLAGGVNGNGGLGVGAAVVTVVSGKKVQAAAYSADAAMNLNIAADNTDDIQQLALSVGLSGSTGVQIGAAVQVLRNQVSASAGGTGGQLNAAAGDFTLTSHNDIQLVNLGAAVAAAAEAAITPVGVVTYFQGGSDARVLSGSAVEVGNGKSISIQATSDKDINLYSLGVAAGDVGLSGTANVLVSRDSASAIAEDGAALRTAGDVNLSATGDYRLRSATAALVAGDTGIGVNAVVSVLKSNTLAELAGNAEAQTGNAKSVNVSASAKRDVINVVANLGAGSTGGGVSALVLVAGTKMSQDAADMIAYGNGSSREKKTGFDGKTFMDTMEQNGIASRYYRDDSSPSGDDLSGDTLAADLAGNGHYESKESVGTSSGKGDDRRSTFDGASGMRSGDFDDTTFDDRGDRMRGETMEAKDTEDIARARNMNTYTYEETSDDAVIARIAETAAVKADSVSVAAAQPAAADLLGASVGAGSLGGGISAAVAILRSNVIASSLGTITGASQGISVTAKSVAGDLTNDPDAGARDDTVLDLMSNNGDQQQSEESKQDLIAKLKDKLNPSNRAIRTFGLALGVGETGIAVAASVALTDNVTEATLGGTVENAGNVNVQAEHDYGTILAATGALAAGEIAADVSVSVAQANGDVRATVNRDATVSANTLSVSTAANVGVDAAAVTVGAGAIAVNGGLGLAINRLNQETGILGGAVVTTEKNVNVTAASTAAAGSYLLGVAAGGIGITLNGAVSDVDTKVNTHIGETSLKRKTASVTAGGDVTVSNQTSSSATPMALSAAIGGVAVGGNVLLAFNDSRVEAAVRNASLKSGSLSVTSDLDGRAESDLASAQIGAIAVGLSVNYADINATNQAVVVNSTADLAGDMTILTGKNETTGTAARADTISGDLGLIAAGMNAAIARNRTKNYAILSGDGAVNVQGNLTINAQSNPAAQASLTGLDIGLTNAAVTAVVALNEAEARTKVRTKNLHVKGETGLTTRQQAATTADITTGGGGLLGATISAAVAYGRTNALVDATLRGDAKLEGALKVENISGDNATSRITNQTFDAISVSALAGAAYSQDQIDTRVRFRGDDQTIGSANIQTVYDITGTADVTPSAGGVSASVLELALNLALAKSTASVNTQFETLMATHVRGDLKIQTIGAGSTDAKINSAKITVDGASLGASLALSELSTVQTAELHIDEKTPDVRSTLDVDGDLSVRSLRKDMTANASLGTSGRGSDSSIDVSLFNEKTNASFAWMNLDSTAAITSDAKMIPEVTANSLKVEAARANETALGRAEARTDGAKDVSLVTAGNLDAQAIASENAKAQIHYLYATITKNVDISAITHGESNAIGFVPGKLAVVSDGSSTVKAGIGTQDRPQRALVTIDGDATHLEGENVKVISENNGSAAAETKGGTSYTIGTVSNSNQPTESWYETGVNVDDESLLMAASDIEVTSTTNPNAESLLNGGSLGLILNADTMKGENSINETNHLRIGSLTKLRAKGKIHVGTYSTVLADAETKYDGNYSFYGGSSVYARNSLNRNVMVELREYAILEAGDTLTINSLVGAGEQIKTYAKQTTSDVANFASADAAVDTTLTNTIQISQESQLTGTTVDISAISTGYLDDDNSGYRTIGEVNGDGFSGDDAPNGYAKLKMDYNTSVIINPEQGKDDNRVKIKATDGEIHLRATNWDLWTRSDTNLSGDGAVGGLDAYTTADLTLQNTIWVDNVDFDATKTGLYASGGVNEGKKAVFNVYSTVALAALAGYEAGTATIKGSHYTNILTHNRDGVSVTGDFEHLSYCGLDYHLAVNCNGWPNIPGSRTYNDDIDLNQKDDFYDGVNGNGLAPLIDRDPMLRGALKKGLAPLEDIQRTENAVGLLTQAPAFRLNRDAAAKLYVMDMEATLSKDVRLEQDEISQRKLWVNTETRMEVYLLPDATRLYTDGNGKPRFVSEVHLDASDHPVDIFTALTEEAAEAPVIPIGSTASLNFADGTLSLPNRASFQLYLNELSGGWLIQRMKDGSIRGVIAPQEQVNAFVRGEAEWPEGDVISGLTEGTHDRFNVEGGTLYWLGDTPETAKDPEETLIFLIEEKKLDRVSAFHTSVDSMAKGQAPTRVSLYLYPDGGTDDTGAEAYNVLFSDTPAGEKSRVRVISGTLRDRETQELMNTQLTLRAFRIENTLPTYIIDDHFYVLCDVTKSSVSLLNGAYQATFDGDTFESKTLLIEGIRDGVLGIMLQEGQQIWPEWTDEDMAQDLEKRTYVRNNEAWTVR